MQWPKLKFLQVHCRQRTLNYILSPYAIWILSTTLVLFFLAVLTINLQTAKTKILALRTEKAGFPRIRISQRTIHTVDKHISNTSVSPELILFTTMYISTEKDAVLNLVLDMWKSWKPSIKPLMFASDSDVIANALRCDWPTLPEPRKNPACFGPPLFPNMFIDTMRNYNAKFYGFANADILFDDGLAHTVTALSKIKSLIDKPVFIIGKRIIFDFMKYGHLLSKPEDVSALKHLGEEIHWSSDYWITTRSFPWTELLPLTVGRPFFDRWTMAYAIENENITVIDTSATIKAMHMTTQDGNFSSWLKPGNDCNVNIIMDGLPKVEQMGVGRPECASFETYWDDGEVKLRDREPSRTECKPFYVPQKRQVWFLDPKLGINAKQT